MRSRDVAWQVFKEKSTGLCLFFFAMQRSDTEKTSTRQNLTKKEVFFFHFEVGNLAVVNHLRSIGETRIPAK